MSEVPFVPIAEALPNISVQQPPEDWTVVDTVTIVKALDKDGDLTIGVLFSDRASIHPSELVGFLESLSAVFKYKVMSQMANFVSGEE